jgi:predicted secreted protein
VAGDAAVIGASVKRALRRLRPLPPASDSRGGRIVAVIECILNQNARDAGAAMAPAMSWEVVSLCHAHGVGMVQLPCPEIACLGVARTRAPGCSIRAALDTEAGHLRCAELGVQAADRLEAYLRAGCQVLAVLGGNPQSPGCAVHFDGQGLAPAAGIFMGELHAELRRRGLDIPLRGMRDGDRVLLAEDLQWLTRLFADQGATLP